MLLDEENNPHINPRFESSRTHSQLNDFYTSFATVSSSNTQDNISSMKYSNLKLTYLIITGINSILGLLTLFQHGTIIKENHFSVYFYLILFTFLWPINLLISSIFSSFILIYKNIKNSENLYENENNFTRQDFYSYFVLIFVIILVIFYTISIPYSLYMIYLLIKNKILNSQFKNYLHVYLFISVNLVKSLVIFIVAFYYLIKEKFVSQQFKINLDEEFIKQVEKEIEQANKFSGVISASKDLIKMNEMFNRQYFKFEDVGRNNLNKNENENININIKEIIVKESYEERKSRIISMIKTQTMDIEDNSQKRLIKNLKEEIHSRRQSASNLFGDMRHSSNNFKSKYGNSFFFDENEEDIENKSNISSINNFDISNNSNNEIELKVKNSNKIQHISPSNFSNNFEFFDRNKNSSSTCKTFSNKYFKSNLSKDDINIHLGISVRNFKLID